MILILGYPDDHCGKVAAHLEKASADFKIWNTKCFPTQSRFGFYLRPLQASESKSSPAQILRGQWVLNIQEDEPEIQLDQIQSVYWYYNFGVDIDATGQADCYHLGEVEAALYTLFRCMASARWVNSPQAIGQHRYKTYQLQLMNRLGLRTPKTLVSNQYDEILSFFDQCPRGVVHKNMTGIGYPKAFQAKEHFIEQYPVEDWSGLPGFFQEWVKGIDTRIHVVGEDCFVSTVHSEAWTFVQDPQCQIKPGTLPDEVLQSCLDVRRACGYQLSGIDLRQTPEGEFVFLEANPSPQFGRYEEACDYPISQAIANLLMA
jgi:hypothetical protein